MAVQLLRGKEKTKNDYEAIGWQHLTKVELKYTLYCKAEIGSNPIIITKKMPDQQYLPNN
jgi:hypothetical protein